MEFEEMKPMYDFYTKYSKDTRDYNEFYSDAFDQAILMQQTEINYSFEKTQAPLYNFISDFIWIRNGKICYKIHPKITETFSNAKMESIPCNLLLPKNDTECFTVSLAKDDHGITNNFGKKLKSFMVLRCKQHHEIKLKKKIWVIPNNMFVITTDWGEYDALKRHEFPVYSISTFLWKTGEELLEDRLSKTYEKSEDTDMSQETLNKIFRLAISICFLVQNNNPLIEPDILTKDLADYYRNPILREKLAEKAFKKRNKKSYKIGCSREHEFILKQNVPLQSDNFSQTDKHLTTSHLRGGHWHLVRFGKNKSESKVMWYFPTIVRPDLPFKG